MGQIGEIMGRPQPLENRCSAFGQSGPGVLATGALALQGTLGKTNPFVPKLKTLRLVPRVCVPPVPFRTTAG